MYTTLCSDSAKIQIRVPFAQSRRRVQKVCRTGAFVIFLARFSTFWRRAVRIYDSLTPHIDFVFGRSRLHRSLRYTHENCCLGWMGGCDATVPTLSLASHTNPHSTVHSSEPLALALVLFPSSQASLPTCRPSPQIAVQLVVLVSSWSTEEDKHGNPPLNLTIL